MGDASDADCLGSGHSRRGLLLPLARVDPLLGDPLHLHLFDPQTTGPKSAITSG